MRETLLQATGLTALQTVILRNFNMVETKVLADTLECLPNDIVEYAKLMGLTQKPYDDKWVKKGYITIIRNNWHLLPQEQIIKLLNWDVAMLKYALKEEDFLDVKLGEKTDCEKVVFTAPTESDKASLQYVKQIVLDLNIKDDHSFEFLTDIEHKKTNGFGDGMRIVSAYNGSCGDTLIKDDLPFSEKLLSILSSININGVWLPAILGELSPSPWEKTLSTDYQIRLKNLNRLIDLAGKYGIKVYLYLNEPRCQSNEFFSDGREYLRGAEENGKFALCTSNIEVKDYLVNSTQYLLSNAMNLGGIITITSSENLTNCYSRSFADTSCPKCSKRTRPDVVSEVNNLMLEGIRKSGSNAKLIAWNWGQHAGFGYNDKNNFEFIDKLDKDIILMCVSEDCLKYDIDGNQQALLDYSISKVGPSEKSANLWTYANKVGIKTFAKVQLNNSWELCAAPYIPVFPTFIKHLKTLHSLGVQNYMLCWTLGSFPGGALPLSSYDYTLSEQKILEEFITNEYGKQNLTAITQAVNCFSDSFSYYPFCLNTLYEGAQNYGVSNPLYPINTGMKSTMIGFPFDNVLHWIAPYSIDTYLKKLEKLLPIWKKGLTYLKDIEKTSKTKMLIDVANVCYINLKSYYNQCIFTLNRDNLIKNQSQKELILDELKLTKQMLEIIYNNPYIGFEASNHYLFSVNNLIEKTINLNHLL